MIGILFFCFIFSFGAVSATNYTVTPSDSIQSKIDDASTGDTLNLVTGTYNQYNIKVNKSLTISGPNTSGSPTAVIDAQNQGRVFNITTGVNVTLKYLTITKGNASKDSINTNGGGIYSYGNVTLTGCIINNNIANWGGGIFNNGTMTIINSKIIQNIETGNIWGGAGIFNNGTMTIIGSNINNNNASYGGNGGGICNNGNLTITNTNINNNNASDGGGILNNSNMTITNSNINNNTASSSYGGGITTLRCNCIIYNSNINYNTAEIGGGIRSSWGNLSIFNSNINYNTATTYSNGGAGIFSYYDSLNIVNSTLKGNKGIRGGGIWNWEGNCTITSSNIISNFASDVGGGIQIYTGNLNVTNSNISNNIAISGSGIYNNGFTIVTNSILSNNKATTDGGGIYNNGNLILNCSNINYNTAINGGGILNKGTMNITDSNINANTATTDGGGIFNIKGFLTVTDSNIKDNNANFGGGLLIRDTGTFTITSCDIESNTANNYGNAIYNDNGDTTTRIFHFNRFYNTKPGYEIYCASGGVDAMLNWWGSNNNPSSKVYGNVYAIPWLVLKLSANPLLIGKNVKTNITADLRYDSINGYHDPSNGYFPNNTPIQFFTTLGTITSSIKTNSGTAIAVLTGGSNSGMADVFASLDDEIVSTQVNIETTPPTITIIDPPNKATNVPANKVINVTFNENIENGTGWVELKNSNGANISVTTSITDNVFSITPTGSLSEGFYTLLMHTGAVTDLAGNMVAAASSSFSTGTSPTITNSDPVNNAVNVARNKVITVTFSEPIKAGTMWIELYNTIGTKALIPITTIISGNVLTINHAALLANGTKYTLVLHSGSITDLAGNSLAGVASYFTTSTDGTASTVTSTDPVNNAVNVARNKVITVTFSEPIKAGTMWIELYNTGTKALIPITTIISGNVLTIKHAALLANGTKYTLVLHSGSITDLAGNSLAGVASYFTTGTI